MYPYLKITLIVFPFLYSKHDNLWSPIIFNFLLLRWIDIRIYGVVCRK